MHLMYFTEQPMSAYDEQAGRDFGATAAGWAAHAGHRELAAWLDHLASVRPV